MFRMMMAAGLAACAGLGAAMAQDAGEAEAPAEAVEPAADAPEAGADSAPTALDWPVPEPVDFVCPFKSEIDYEPGDIACGFISVPENREDPDSRMIRLHYVKIAATGEDEDYREDPVIYLTGGPGVGVGGYVDRLREHAVLEQRDLYILEQRGIGASGDFCPHYGQTERALATAAGIEEAQRNAAEITRNCFEAAAAAGVDLTGYNTVENARDVRALRRALGFESWNVWGISYGSHLGQMLVREDPEGISALVIDAIVPNDLVDLMRIGRWANRVADNIFSTCEDAEVCRDLEARFDAALVEAKENPVVVEVEDTELFPDGEVRVGAEILAFAPFGMMYEQDEHPAIPAVMDALIRSAGDPDAPIYDLVANGGGGAPAGMSLSMGMASAIRCNDGYVAAAGEIVESDLAENPRFRDIFFTPEGQRYVAEMCVEAGLAPRDRADYQLVETDIPTLIVNGAWDPVTPPPLARRVAPGFSNGRYIEVPYAGHGPTRSMSDCAGPVLNAFFDDPDPAALDATCLEEGVDRPVYLDLFATEAPARLAAAAAIDPKRLAAPGIWAGASILVLLVSFLLIVFGAGARLVDRQSASELKADIGGARLFAFLAAASGLGFAGLAGYAGWAAQEISMFALIAGLAPVGGIASWLAVAAGAFGLLALIALIRRRMSDGPVRFGSLIGLVMTSAAAMALFAFAARYDLLPM
ncbi:hypothetical protein DDZ18_01140 [Marinicauda salina]|uniref:Proline iminopeptidase n=1 Tax=Marinicauda salina TaxID=2135793 RepID=A0A2U2BW50_9PROT|nr:alpha/beta hydrolase [Marinicauda salina]PWE18243.1 hypothetical protein DDZ18_01140 [Marinicauda salina]